MRGFVRLLPLLTVLVLLAGCGGEPMGSYPLDGGMTCQTYGSETGLSRLEITTASGETVRFSLPRATLEPNPAGGFELVDMNFDGHADLRVAYKKMANGDMRYTCFLWQEDGVVKSEQLSALRGMEIDAKAEVLTAWDRYVIPEEHESRSRTRYMWQDGTLWAVEKRELLYYPEEGVYCLIDSAAVPGEALTVQDERWIFPEKFDENEIWN
ncbi:MAG: hypothetical protein E7654_06210 [Ruminococcaceae bacterium]|nr:hypothetical protein [Oscillospiraceae bacterium]